MSSTNEYDPFLQVQADVLSQLHNTRSLYDSYLRIRSFVTSPDSPELLSSISELNSAIESLSEDLSDLKASVQAVQSDPYKYGLEIEEVVRRRKLCDELNGELREMQGELGKKISASTISKNGQNNFGSDSDDTRDEYTAFEEQQQLQMLADQDSQLESVSKTVYNIRQQASDMGRELEEQAEILDRVDGLADRVGGRLQTGVKAMGTVIKRNEDGLSSCCITALILVLIVLLVLVLVW